MLKNYFNKLWATSFFFLGFILQVSGQFNIAPQATVTASTCNTGPCSTLNDLNFGTCGTQQMWITTGTPPSLNPGDNFIEWNWTQNQVIDRMVIHHAQDITRFLAGALIQTWNGSTWVDHHLFLNLPAQCVNTVFFPILATNRMRITSFRASGSQLSNMNFREIEIINVASDIEMKSISLSGNPLCSGKPSDVSILLRNNGPAVGKQMRLAIDMAGQNRLVQDIQLNDLTIGKDTTIFLPGFFKTNINGNNLEVKAISILGDITAINDTTSTLINVTPAPYGAAFTPESNFDGRLDLGINGYPDMVLAGSTAKYTFSAPTNYSNTGYGTAWTVSNVSSTVNGTMVPTSFASITNPGANDGKFEITFPDNFEDSTVIVKLRLNSANGCDSIIERYIYIAPLTKVNFTYKQSCQGRETEFENLSSLAKGVPNYYWVFGDGSDTFQTFANPLKTYSGNGSYDVTLIAITELGFVSDTTITIQVTETPVADFSFKNACEGDNVELKDLSQFSSGTLNYTWTLGDNNSASTKDVNHQYANPGTYEVTLYVISNAGCDASITKNVQQHPNPVAAFNAPSMPVCSNTPINFPNLSTIAYTKMGANWNFGNNQTSKSLNPTFAFDAEGSYNVTLVMETEFGCKDSTTENVLILGSPLASFDVLQACLNADATLLSTSTVNPAGNPTFSWKTGDGNTLNGESVNHIFSNRGTYQVELEVTYGSGCKNTAIKTIVVDEKPNAAFETNPTCQGTSTLFANLTTFKNGKLNSFWNLGDGNTSTAMHPSHVYAANGTYNVQLIASAGTSCNDTISQTVTVNETPECGFTAEIDWANGYVPGNRSYKFTPDNKNYDSYEWIIANNRKNAVEAQHTFMLDGSYTVTLIASTKEGCSCSNTQQVAISTTGLQNIEMNAVKYFPNPASNELNIETSLNNARYNIVDATGRELMNGTLLKGNNKLNVQSLQNGFYFVRIMDNNAIGVYPLQILK
jgi:PKD repeat protein